MTQIKAFRFVSYRFDAEKSLVSLRYAFDDIYHFEEKITFHNAKTSLSVNEKSAIERILFFMHIACGISYYKAFVPSEVVVETGTLTKDQAAFFDEFYKKGLGEFSWCNRLDLNNIIKFPVSQNASFDTSSDLELPEVTAVPIGGGKDSNVVLEILKSHNENIICIAQGRPRPIKESIEVSGCKEIEFTRSIAAELIELNKQAGVYNGHVPITGVYAFCMSLAAVLYGFDKIAMGNERSANVGNVIREDDFEVNHQWSKSFAFEESFNHFTKAFMLANLHYFSMLRPLSELDIASRFAKLKPYFGVFTSCNKAFRIDKEKRLDRWCGNCDKCRFVFLALSPFMDKNDLVSAVGKNILDDYTQLEGFEELLGLSNHKPFECVGELEECVVAVYLTAQKIEWQDSCLIKNLYPRLLEKYGLAKIKNWEKLVFTPATQHLIPQNFKDYL